MTGPNTYGGGTTVSAGTLQILGGQLPATDEQVGPSGLASLVQSGGTHSVSSILFLGNASGSVGTYNLSGSGLLSAFDEYIGSSYGSGNFTQSGGVNAVSYPFVGYGSYSHGTYNLSGSGQLLANTEYIAYYGVAAFTQSGGTQSAGTLYLGYNGNATYNLSGSGLLSAAGECLGYIDDGFSGNGTFTQTGGTNAVSGNLVLGQGAGSVGTYYLNGGLLGVSGLVQGAGSAVFSIGGGTFQAASTFSTVMPLLLSTAGSNAVFDTNGNTLTLAGPVSGPGGLQKIGAGVLALACSNTFTGLTLINAGTLSLANSAALAGNGNITFGGGTLQFTASNTLDCAGRIINSTAPIQLDTNGQSVGFSGGLSSSNSAGLIKIGAGTLTLSASNGYTGTTLVFGGTLLLANPNAVSGSTFDTSGGGSLSFGTLTSATFDGLQGSGNLVLSNTGEGPCR